MNRAIQTPRLDFGTEPLTSTYEWPNECVSTTATTGPKEETITIKSIISRLHSETKEREKDFRSFLTASETSTEQLPISDEIEGELANLFSIANDGLFDDDQTNKFSERLTGLIYLYGDATIRGLSPFIIGERATAESAAATLSCLSHLESRISYHYRIWLMERALQSTSSWIRDAAASALESLDDPSAIPYIQEAFTNEPNAELRQYLSTVHQLLLRKR